MKNKGAWAIIIIIFLVFGVIFAIYLSQMGRRTWEDIQEDQTLRVVTQLNSIDYFIADGKPQGFYYEMVRDLADSLGLQLDITLEPDYKKSLEGIRRGEYDIFLTNIPITTESRKHIILAQPIMKGKLVLVQKRKDLSDKGFIEQATDLEGADLYIEAGSPYIMRLENLKEEVGVNFNIIEKNEISSELLNSMVARGQIDYVVCSEHVANLSKRYHYELDVNTLLGLTQNLTWAMVECPELNQKVNAFINQYTDSKKYKKLYQTYYYPLKK